MDGYDSEEILLAMEQQELDIISSVMALTSYRNIKNLIIMGVELVGPFYEDAFRSAVRETSIKFPTMTSVLREVRSKWRFSLVREASPATGVPIFVSDLPNSHGGRSSFDALMEHLTPRLERQWQLFRDPPVEIHVVRADSNHSSLLFIVHHAVADAAMALSLITEMFGQYEKILTGRQSRWSEMPHVFSTSHKKAAVAGKSGWKDLFSQLRRNLSYRNDRPAKPVGNGAAEDLREWQVREVLSAEDTEGLLCRLSQHGFHFVDHLVACSTLALEEWNRDGNVPSGTINSVVTVNMRQRFGGAEEKNYSSCLFFRAAPSDRKTYLELVGFLAQSRTRQLQRGADLSLRGAFSLGAKLFSILPLGIRRRVASSFMMQQRYSLAVGFLGAVWPQFEAGSKTAHPHLRRMADLDIIDVYGTGYKLAGNAHVNLYAYLYAGRLHVVLAMSARLLNKEECRDFFSLVVQHIGRSGA
jgi:hypothetical protein